MQLTSRISKPLLAGGTKAPVGFKWKVYAISPHHSVVIGALANYRKQHTSEVLSAAISFYASHCQDELDKAFKTDHLKVKNEAE